MTSLKMTSLSVSFSMPSRKIRRATATHPCRHLFSCEQLRNRTADASEYHTVSYLSKPLLFVEGTQDNMRSYPKRAAHQVHTLAVLVDNCIEMGMTAPMPRSTTATKTRESLALLRFCFYINVLVQDLRETRLETVATLAYYELT